MRLIIVIFLVSSVYFVKCKPSNGFDYFNLLTEDQAIDECMKPVKDNVGWWECTKFESSWVDSTALGLEYCAILRVSAIDDGLYECRKASPPIIQI